jgi:hypothetical protein
MSSPTISTIERQAYEVSAYREGRRESKKKDKTKLCHCEPLAARQSRKTFFNSFVSLSLKGLATIFLEQARKRQRTCHAVVSSLRDTLVFLILFGRCGTRCCKQQLQTSPHALSSQNQKYFGDTNAWV